jgi:predicted ester cyclase
MTAQDLAERTNAEVVRRYFDLVWNRGDLAAVERFFGDEFTNFGHRGPDARALIAQIVTTWRTAFPDLRFEIDDEVVRGDAVVHLITCAGTHTKEHSSIQPWGAACDRSLLQGRPHAHPSSARRPDRPALGDP